MWEAKILDKQKGIIYLKWSGNVTLEEVSLREFNLFKPDTQPLIVEQQKMVITRGLKRSTVVLSSAILKLQLGRTARASANSSHEFHFDNYDEALAFLSK